jgi:anti-sigma factor RsiW
MMMDAWTDRLSEYLDGELDGAERLAMEAHLADCETCRTSLLELQAVVQQASALPRLEPARDLWADIAAGIDASAEPTIVPFPGFARRRRFSFSMPQLAAAGITIVAISAGAMWYAMGAANQAAPAVQPPVVSTVDAVPEPGAQLVSDVEDNYDGAIAELEQALAATRDDLDPRTVAVIEENLKIIDAAITDARKALADDPNDVDLYQYLDHTLMKKIDLLRRATSLRRAQT